MYYLPLSKDRARRQRYIIDNTSFKHKISNFIPEIFTSDLSDFGKSLVDLSCPTVNWVACIKWSYNLKTSNIKGHRDINTVIKLLNISERSV